MIAYCFLFLLNYYFAIRIFLNSTLQTSRRLCRIATTEWGFYEPLCRHSTLEIITKRIYSKTWWWKWRTKLVSSIEKRRCEKFDQKFLWSQLVRIRKICEFEFLFFWIFVVYIYHYFHRTTEHITLLNPNTSRNEKFSIQRKKENFKKQKISPLSKSPKTKIFLTSGVWLNEKRTYAA